MWKILLQEFWNDLRTQKTRAFLTMFAISWGTVSVVLLLAFGEGLGQTMQRGLLNAGNRIFQVYGGETSIPFQGLDKGRRIRLRKDDLQVLRQSIPEIELASVSYGRWGVALQVGTNKTNTYMEGVGPEFEEMRRMYPVMGGRFLNEQDIRHKRRVLFLGDEIAGRLFPDGEPVGKQVMLDGLPFTVIGVMQSKLQTSMNNGPDANRAIIPSTTFETIYGHKYVNHFVLRPRSVEEAPALKSKLYEVLGRKYKFDPSDERAIGVWDFIENEKEGAKVFLGIEIFLGVIGGFTLLIAGVGVANIMYVTVKERTNEFGVKLALGARKHHIKLQVIFESLLIALTGGIAGLLFSWAVVSGAQRLPKEGAMEFLSNPVISVPISVVTVGILLLIGLVAGFFPARRAANVDPVESLRYE